MARRRLGVTAALLLVVACKVKLVDGPDFDTEGLIPCETSDTCPAPEDSPCLAALCLEGFCVHTPAPDGPLPDVDQVAGDCRHLYCSAGGAVVPYPARFDTPADDGNRCTEAICEVSTPAQRPKEAGAVCGETKICTGTGICGVCLPTAQRCEGQAISSCDAQGQWSEAQPCAVSQPVCVATPALAAVGAPGAQLAAATCIGAIELAVGAADTCVRFEDGSVRCWGGSSADLSATSAQEPAWSATFTKVAYGVNHACGVRIDGSAWCWGANDYGQLGVDSYESSNAVAQVAGLSGVTDIAVGRQHSCAIAQGVVHCWGRNDRGQLGSAQPGPRATTQPPSDAPTPSMVLGSASQAAPGLIEGVEATGLNLSGAMTCLRTSTTTQCWGLASFPLPEPIVTPEPPDGADGDPAPTPNEPDDPVAERDKLARRVPVAIGGLSATQLSCGDQHCCAIAAGNVHCWGGNDAKQLGSGTKDRFKPVVVPGPTSVSQIGSGSGHACALTGGGEVWCWGDNQRGQSGTGGESATEPPKRIATMTKASALGVGMRHACALLATGEVHCWGDHAVGQLGSGEVPSDGVARQPVPVRW